MVDAALRHVVALRGELPAKVIFHADRGAQYTVSNWPTPPANLTSCGPWAVPGVCWDEMIAESFWSVFENGQYQSL